MKPILILIVDYLFCFISCELVVAGARLQSRFFRILILHTLFAAAALALLWHFFEIHPLPVIIFSTGAFFAWFGVRSHIESSILLRMIYLLRKESLTRKELLDRYENHYGSSLRLRELEQAGLLQNTAKEIRLTPKGCWVLKIAAHLRRKYR